LHPSPHTYLRPMFRYQLFSDLICSQSLLNGCNLKPLVQILSDVKNRFLPCPHHIFIFNRLRLQGTGACSLSTFWLKLKGSASMNSLKNTRHPIGCLFSLLDQTPVVSAISASQRACIGSFLTQPFIPAYGT